MSRKAKRRPRDDRGWRVPKHGTLSRQIYDLLARGKSTSEIASELGIKVTSTRVLAYKIRNSEMVNARNATASQEAARRRIRPRLSILF
jgi:DNA-binding CsgD family transcriptional regulator